MMKKHTIQQKNLGSNLDWNSTPLAYKSSAFPTPPPPFTQFSLSQSPITRATVKLIDPTACLISRDTNKLLFNLQTQIYDFWPTSMTFDHHQQVRKNI